MDAEGLSRCGGEGCDSIVTTASNAWKKAKESQQEIISAMEEVEKLSKMVSPTVLVILCIKTRLPIWHLWQFFR